jgi:predicted RNase H-like nuclease (RuvC/YqgF family)
MKKAIWLVVPIVLFLWGVSAAEYYRYTDRDGHVRYTDDLSTVPPDQRPDVKSYEESDSIEEPSPADDAATPASTKSAKTPAPRQNMTLDAQAEQIRKTKSELDRQYADLMNEKARLEEFRKRAKRKKDIDRVNREISKLNDKIFQWEQKRDAFNAKLDAYNARVIEEAKKKQPTPASP